MKRVPAGEKIMVFGAVILIVLAILKSWPGGELQKKEPPPGDASPTSAALFSINWLAKLHVGIQTIVQDRRELLLQWNFTEKQIENISSGHFAAQYLFPSDGDQQASEESSEDLDVIRARLIVASHFRLEKRINAQITQLKAALKGEPPERIDQVLFSYAEQAGQSPATLSPQEWDVWEEKLGWVAELLNYDLNSDRGASRELLNNAKHFALRFGTFLIFASICFVVGAAGALVFFARAFRGKLQFKFTAPGIPPKTILLTFICYLAALNSSELLQILFVNIPSLTMRLVLQIGFFILVGGIIFLPVLLGVSFRSVTAAVGLRADDGKTNALSEALLGPVAYLSFWPILIMFLLVYSLFLKVLGHSAVEGSHPVVPLLLNKETTPSAYMLLMFLAVILAPCLEELMFRGLFYSWLRTYLGRAASIFICGFVFAVIHPQGMFGILPLTLIGCGLSFLREWRGTLYAPIVAHACNNAMIFAFLLTMRG